MGFADGAGAQLKNAKGQDQHYAQPVVEGLALGEKPLPEPQGPKG